MKKDDHEIADYVSAGGFCICLSTEMQMHIKKNKGAP